MSCDFFVNTKRHTNTYKFELMKWQKNNGRTKLGREGFTKSHAESIYSLIYGLLKFDKKKLQIYFYVITRGGPTQIGLWAATFKFCWKYRLFGPLDNKNKFGSLKFFWATDWPHLVITNRSLRFQPNPDFNPKAKAEILEPKSQLNKPNHNLALLGPII